METISKFIAPRQKIDVPQKIPRKIFQTHETNKLPKRMINTGCKSWIIKNPEYEYHFYDNHDRITLIKNNFDESVFNAYQQLNNGAMKADLFRYCVIYIHGGVYTDIDQVCLKPLAQIIPADADIVTGVAVNTPHQSFMMYSPKCPILKLAIDQSVTRILAKKPLRGKWGWPSGYTGPIALEYAWKTFLEQPRPVTEKGDYDGRFKVPLRRGNFIYKNLKFAVNPKSFFDLRYLTVKYRGYDEDSKKIGATHWSKDRKL